MEEEPEGDRDKQRSRTPSGKRPHSHALSRTESV